MIQQDKNESAAGVECFYIPNFDRMLVKKSSHHARKIDHYRS